MLQVTTNAASALADTRAQRGLPDHYGIRIFGSATATPDMKSAFQFRFVEEPQADDEVTEAEGTRVFLAPEVAPALDNSVLDTKAGRLVLKSHAREGSRRNTENGD